MVAQWSVGLATRSTAPAFIVEPPRLGAERRGYTAHGSASALCHGEASPLSPDDAPLSGSDTGLMSPSLCALVLALSVPVLTLTIGRSNDTKFVAIGVRHDQVIGMGRVLPRQTGGTERLQPGDFRPLIIRIEIEM